MRQSGHSTMDLTHLVKGITSERYEIKYILSEAQAMMIRAYIDDYVEDDAHSDSHHHYPVVSLYYDARGMPMFWSSDRGEKNRLKLRVRWYAHEEPSHLFLETKRRVDRVVGKDRCTLRKSDGDTYLQRGILPQSAFSSLESEDAHGFFEFQELSDRLTATPKVLVRYTREACVGIHGEALRLTFDRDIACSPCDHYSRDTWNESRPWYDIPDHPVVFEIKFNGPFPGWLARMARRFNLSARSVSKYVLAVKELNRQGIYVDSPVQYL